MRSDRVARALLRLYPRAWRQRYGDEFLALIADTGLSWRTAIDIVAAAAFERVLWLVVLIRSDVDPQTAQIATVPFREMVREGAWFLGLTVPTVAIVASSGIALPSWSWWYFTLTNWVVGGAWVTTRPTASSSERAVLAFFWNALAIGGAGLAWAISSLARWLGVAEPPDHVVYWSFGLFFGAVACRGIYASIRSQMFVSSWEGIHAREIVAWRVGLFAVIVLASFLDPKAETFWSLSLIMAISFQVPRNAMRFAAARRRPAYERSEETWAFKKVDRS